MRDAGPAVCLPKYELFALASTTRSGGQAERVVQKLLAQALGAATDLANHLPVTVVSNPPRASFTRADRAHPCRPRAKPTSPTIVSAQPIDPADH
jgi:hypothetical protein